MENKSLPKDTNVEMAVLGEILLGSKAGLDSIEALHDDYFYDSRNQTIFRVINQMFKEGREIDMITVCSKINSMEMIELAGGNAYISSLVTMSGASVPEKYIEILKEKMNLRKIIETSEAAKSMAYGGSDSEEVLNRIENDVFSLKDESNSGNLLEMASISVLDALERKKSGEVVMGIKTSIDPLDRLLGGLNPLFYVLASRARMGKSALIAQIIGRLLVEKRPTLLFEKDMSSELFVLRMACSLANVNFSKYYMGYCQGSEYDDVKRSIEFIRKSPFYIYSPPNFTVSTMASIVRKEKRTHGIQAVFLDHVLNLDVGKDYRTGLTLASTRIRDSVEESKIPHVILAQLNRGAHNTERPTPAHIKEFDALFADCDAMLMLWSELETQDVPPSNLFPMKLTCCKNRYGPEFEEDIGFDRPLMKFRSEKGKL